ncbi:4-hydroxy-tetrahydrodipicolinate reductase, partial [Frankliniella fusca]
SGSPSKGRRKTNAGPSLGGGGGGQHGNGAGLRATLREDHSLSPVHTPIPRLVKENEKNTSAFGAMPIAGAPALASNQDQILGKYTDEADEMTSSAVMEYRVPDDYCRHVVSWHLVPGTVVAVLFHFRL